MKRFGRALPRNERNFRISNDVYVIPMNWIRGSFSESQWKPVSSKSKTVNGK